jgi:TP901 family phage tail tape measure protein
MASPAAILQVFVNANTKVASAQLKAFQGQMLGVGKTSAATSAGMGKFTKGAAAAGAGVAAFGAAAVVAGKQLYDLGAEFDRAYDRIRVGTGATGRELEKLKGSFKEVAKTVPNDFEEVGTAIADLNTRLGLTGKPLEDMAQNMLHLSNITGDSLEGNIKSVSRAFVDWEVEIPKQTDYLDGLFRLSQKSGASVGQLTDSVQKFGSPLRQLGFEFGEAAATFAMFERAGVNTQTMVPGLKLAIANLTRPTEGLAQEMGKLGIEAGKPDKALRQVFDLLGNSKELSKVEKTGLAMDVFGKRAGSDMAEAIKQGRFEVDKYLKVFRDNKGDSIRRAADETYDFSENAKILGNNLKTYLEPAANAVFVAVDRAVRALNQGIKEMQGTSDKSTTVGNVLKALAVVVYGLGKAFQVLFRTSKRMIEGTAEIVRGFWQVVKNTFRLIGAVIRGDWRKAWQAAKSIVKGYIKQIGGVIRTVTAPVRSAWQAIVEIVRDKFKAAYSAAVSFVNGIIRIINKIPGVDIGAVSVSNSNPFGEGSSRRGRAAGLQRGGVLHGGKPSGDSIPAMLERGEYVLNREAVKKVGVERLNALNFKNAPRFQRGGVIGMNVGGAVADAVEQGIGIGQRVIDMIAEGPSAFIKKLPKANLPEPITGVGPYLLKAAKKFITRKVSQLLESQSSSGVPGYVGPPPDFRQLGNNAWVDRNTLAVGNYLANRFGVSITDGWRPQNAGYGAVNSSHKRGTPGNPGALDFAPPSTALQAFAGKRIAGLTENDIHDWGTGLHNHIAFFRRGGLAGRLRKMAKGGWVKTGYTVFDDAGGGYRGHLQKGKGYAELGTATLGGVATGKGLIARALGMSGELPDKYPLDVKINGKTRRMYKRDRGYGQGDTWHSIDIYKDSWGRFGLGPYSKGTAKIRKIGGGKSKEEIRKEKKRARRQATKLKRIVSRGLKYPGRNNLNKNAAKINRIQERLDVAENQHRAEFSDGGSEISDKELQAEIALLRQRQKAQIERLSILATAWRFLTRTVDSYRKLRKKAKGKKLKDAYAKGIKNALTSRGEVATGLKELIGLNGFGSFRQGKLGAPEQLLYGALGDTNFELKSRGFTASASSVDSDIADLLRQQLETSQRNLAIAQAQAPIFSQFMPKFHQGGIVQGPMGAERPIMAQAGEGVFTRDQMRAMGAGNITVVIEDGAIDSNRIRVEVDGVLQDKISTVRRSTPNRRYATR